MRIIMAPLCPMGARPPQTREQLIDSSGGAVVPVAEPVRVGPSVTQDGAPSFGDLLRDFRLAAGLSQETLAERSRMSAAGISVLERGIRRAPNRGTLAQLADALALSPADRERFEAAAARPAQPRRRKSAAPASHNLPSKLTSFIGRVTEIGEIARLVRCRRLVTLVGSGGVGKTRCALQVAANATRTFVDGVWFIELAPIADPSLVAGAIAQAIGAPRSPDRAPLENVVGYLKRKQLLLLLDNCEHVVDEAGNVAAAILYACPGVRILSTSREALRVAGEDVYRMPSLELASAVTLFADRALSVEKRFELSDKSRPHVDEICRRLDGIPLAIELAAARVNVLSPQQLVQRLDERFRVLTGGDRSALARHQTMRALFDWSYDLLSDDEQRVFRALSVFAGGFTLQSATAVCDEDELVVLERLSSLVEKSLLEAKPVEGGTRYHFLESMRHYARERLDALEKLRGSGERETLARHHAEYFLDQALAADERYGTGSMLAWLARAELELDNDRAALSWALSRGNDAVLGGALAGALSGLWVNAGLAIEGRNWVELALERVSEAEQPHVAARLWLALSVLSFGQRKHDAAERATRLYASVGDAPGAARAQRVLAFALMLMGRLDEAKAMIEPALAASRAYGDASNVAFCLVVQAPIAGLRGDVRGARELYAQALAAYKTLGNEAGTALVLGDMAELEFADGHPERALRAVSEALEIHVRGKNAVHIAMSHTNGTAYRIALGDLTGARESAREGLRMSRQTRLELGIAVALQHFAVLAVLGGDARHGARLLGYVNSQYKELGIEREATEQWGYEKLMAALRETLSADESAALAADGAAWAEDQAVDEALKV
jgi:predicted ATPase/transcriptional regulator with XRE-family HTH domain